MIKKYKLNQIGLVIMFLTAFTISGLSQTNEKSEPTWQVFWKNGTHINSSDGNFKIKFGGRIMVDYLSINTDAYFDTIVEISQATEFRRTRFFTSGTVYKNIDFKLQMDFATGKAMLKDGYIRIKKIPVVGNLTVGHFKEPIGLELLTSSRFITFMERGLTNVLTPERNTGFMISNYTKNKRFNWSLGYFYPSNSSGFGAYAGNKYNVSGRISGTPIYKTEGRTHILHLGLSATHQNQNNSEYKLTSRPETHLAPKIVFAEIDFAKAVNQYGFELAYMNGPFSFQGEYISAYALTASESTLQHDRYNFTAYYAYMSWFITGESRKFKSSSGVFTMVTPKKSLGEEDGIGAFELAVRFSSLDLDDTDIRGGTLNDITVGLNWYVNPVTRFMVNYINSKLLEKGRIGVLELRGQIDF
jgi:phosphate-selective porin OprO and OprP